MTFIHNLITFSVVFVVLIFIYYLYHTTLINQLTKYNYDTSSNPLLLNLLTTTDLLCPNNYNYVKTSKMDGKDGTYDFCKKSDFDCQNTDYNVPNANCITYKAFERNNQGVIQYPEGVEQENSAIKDRCVKRNNTNICEDKSDPSSQACTLAPNKLNCLYNTGIDTDSKCNLINTKWTALNPYYYSKQCKHNVTHLL